VLLRNRAKPPNLATVKLWYDPGLKRLARELRNRSTLAEVLLWQRLKQGQRGFDFHRQKPIDRYIVDFFSNELMLAVEIDGSSHDLKGERDEQRQRRLESLGVRFLRFRDQEVKTDVDAVVQAVDNWIEANGRKP
jgi:very-short-patch-repair endonuclease